MSTGLLITTIGQAKITADLANIADLIITHVAFGDANGVPYMPHVGMTGLVREKYRTTISSVAIVSGAVVIEAVLPADTNDGSGRPSHGFNVAEACLIDSAGAMIAVAQMSNGYKAPPSSGQAENATFRFLLAVANPSAITVSVDPSSLIHVNRLARAPFISIDSFRTTVPPGAGIGSLVVVNPSATGAFAGQDHKLASWDGSGWVFRDVPHRTIVRDISLSGVWYERTVSGWEVFDVTGQAALDALAAQIRQLLAIYPAINPGVDGLVATTTSVGQIVVGSGNVILHRGVASHNLSAFTLGARTFATVASKTYHLRWYAPGHSHAPANVYPHGNLQLRDVADPAYNPAPVGEKNILFDTDYDNMLLARIVTDGSNNLTVTPLVNLQNMFASHTKSSVTVGGVPADYSAIALNWSRVPISSLISTNVEYPGADARHIALLTARDRYEFKSVVRGYDPGLPGGSQFISGQFNFDLRAYGGI